MTVRECLDRADDDLCKAITADDSECLTDEQHAQIMDAIALVQTVLLWMPTVVKSEEDE